MNYSCGHCDKSFQSIKDIDAHQKTCADEALTEVLSSVNIPDAINPQHYKSANARCTCGRTIECIDIVRHHNMNIGNVIKYLWRADHKGNRQEQLKKAHWYLRDEIRKLEPEFNAGE